MSRVVPISFAKILIFHGIIRFEVRPVLTTSENDLPTTANCGHCKRPYHCRQMSAERRKFVSHQYWRGCVICNKITIKVQFFR